MVKKKRRKLNQLRQSLKFNQNKFSKRNKKYQPHRIWWKLLQKKSLKKHHKLKSPNPKNFSLRKSKKSLMKKSRAVFRLVN